MKKKVFLFVILALVLCLTCGMLLVACDKGGDDDPDKSDVDENQSTLSEVDIEEAWTDIVNGVDAANKADDGEFAFSIEISQTDLEAENYGTLFGLGYEKIGENYYFYGNAGNGGNYVKINGASIGSILDDVFAILEARVSGFSMVNGYPSISGVTLDPSMMKIVSLVSDMLFEKAEMSTDGAYILYLDLDGILTNIPSILKSLVGFIDNTIKLPDNATLSQTIEALAKLEEGKIDGYVAQYAGLIFKDAEITTLDELLEYLAGFLETIEIKIGFMFDQRVADDSTNPFVDVANITNADREENAINILNFNLGATVNGYDAVEEVPADEAAGTEATFNPAGNKTTYNVSLETNLDIFAALDMLTLVADAERDAKTKNDGVIVKAPVAPVEPAEPGADATEEERAKYEEALEAYNEALVAYSDAVREYEDYRALVDGYYEENFASTMVGMLEKVGYLKLTVDEVGGKNLFTFYLNGADGFAVITANVYAAEENPIAAEDGYIKLGGTYDFEALVDYIMVMMEEGWDGSMQDNPADAVSSAFDFNSIINIAKNLIGVVTANVKTNGATGISLNLEGAYADVCEVFGGAEDSIKSAISGDAFVQQLLSFDNSASGLDILGILKGIKALDIVISLPTRVYGAVTTPAAGFGENFTADNGTTLVASIDASEATIKYVGKTVTTGNGFVLGGTFTVTDIFGNEIEININEKPDGILLMWVDYDETAAAAGQTVTAYVTVPTDTLLAMANDETHNNKLAYPLSGLYAITFTVA